MQPTARGLSDFLEPDDPGHFGSLGDALLKSFEIQLAAWLATRRPSEFEISEARIRMRPCVHRLRQLGCPPEVMLLRVKHLLTNLPRPGDRDGVDEWTRFREIRKTLILIGIEEYFDYDRPRPSGRPESGG